MKLVLYLITACLFFSCQQQKQLTRSATSIKGAWQGTRKQVDEYENPNIFFCFEKDSLCTISDYRFADFKYHIDQDTIAIEGIDEENGGYYEYTILKRTDNSLILLSPASDKHPVDTIALKKIHKKNTIKPTAIYFASSGCFGTCPETFLEIDASRNVTFYGGEFTKLTGGFRGKISAAEYETIINQINNLPVDSLKSFYGEISSDEQERGLAIKSAGGVIKSTVVGSYYEPVELTMLLNKLMNMYYHVQLQPDTTIPRDYFSKRLKEDIIVHPEIHKEDL